MPDRILRGGHKESARVNALSDRAECLFYRLLTTVDDAGRYHAEPALIKAACWPLKSHRLADVTRALDELERAGLIARWTDRDGSRLLCLLRFRQKLQYPRPRFAAPPFCPETGELALLQEEEPPDDPAPRPRRARAARAAEEKRREEKRGEGGAERAPPAPPLISESLEQAIARLRAAWPDVDIVAEMKACLKKRGKLDLPFFEKHWLPETGPAVTLEDLAALESAARPSAPAVPELEGWRDVLSGTTYGPGGPFEVLSWAAIARQPSLLEWVSNEIRRRAGGSAA